MCAGEGLEALFGRRFYGTFVPSARVRLVTRDGMADMRLRCNDGENCAASGEADGGPRPPPRRLAAPALSLIHI